jgi:hypothetical protein
MTIQDLLKKADSHWDDADALIDIGTELESRTRLPEARRILERALGLAPKDFPEAYATLAFTHFRDNASTAEKGEMALIQGLEITDSDYLKAWYVAFIDDPPARDYFIQIHDFASFLDMPYCGKECMMKVNVYYQKQ